MSLDGAASLTCGDEGSIAIAPLEITYEHVNGTSCAEVSVSLVLPNASQRLDLDLAHESHSEGLLVASIAVDGAHAPLAVARGASIVDTWRHQFDIDQQLGTIVFRFDGSGGPGSTTIRDMTATITSRPAIERSRDDRLDGDLVSQTTLAIIIDATPLEGMRPSLVVELDDDSTLARIIGPQGDVTGMIERDGTRIVVPAALIELHGSGVYRVEYGEPNPVVATAGLLAWFAILLMSLIAAAALAGYLVVGAARRRGTVIHPVTMVYGLMATATLFAVGRVFFGGDIQTMVRSPLNGVATAQYVLLGVLAVAFLVFAMVLGARHIRHLAHRLRHRNQEAQELEEQHEEMETFTAAAAHDLRAPLRNINAAATFAQRHVGTDPAKVNEFIERIQDGTRRMDELLTALLDYSTVTNAEPTWDHFQVAEAGRVVIDDLQQVIRERNADVEVEGDATMDGDARLVRQALQNLVHNAIKYSPRDPWVRIRIDEDEEQVRIRIVDRGQGIPEADQQRVLAAFERGSNGLDVEGTGLGLATVRKIMDLHDGTLDLMSVEGQGTTFTLVFPRIDPIDEVLLPDGSKAVDLALP